MKFIKFAALLLFASMTAQAADSTYKLITPAQPTDSGDKIEVVEIFQYGCSHCHRFEPLLKRWLKDLPDNVEFVRMPAVFSENLELFARAFYAAEALGELDKLHDPFFAAIHEEKRHINSEDAAIKLAEENGIDGKRFAKAMRSFSVEAKVRRAKELGARYGVSATPSMVVNGKYLTDPGMTGGFAGMLKTVDELIAKEG